MIALRAHPKLSFKLSFPVIERMFMALAIPLSKASNKKHSVRHTKPSETFFLSASFLPFLGGNLIHFEHNDKLTQINFISKKPPRRGRDN